MFPVMDLDQILPIYLLEKRKLRFKKCTLMYHVEIQGNNFYWNFPMT